MKITAEDLLQVKNMVFKNSYISDQRFVFQVVSHEYEKNCTKIELLFNELLKNVSPIEKAMISEFIFLQEYIKSVSDLDMLNKVNDRLRDSSQLL